jgi:hypothetical protein
MTQIIIYLFISKLRLFMKVIIEIIDFENGYQLRYLFYEPIFVYFRDFYIELESDGWEKEILNFYDKNKLNISIHRMWFGNKYYRSTNYLISATRNEEKIVFQELRRINKSLRNKYFSKVNPRVLKAHKIYYNTMRYFDNSEIFTKKLPPIIYFSIFYRHSFNFIYQDFIRFHACVIVAEYFFNFVENQLKINENLKSISEIFNFLNYYLSDCSITEYKEIIDLKKEIEFFTGLEIIERYLTLINNWRNYYSYNFETYRALDVTLNFFPRKIPLAGYLKLLKFKLERPITNRLELISTLSSSESKKNKEILKYSKSNDIKRAFDIYSRARHRNPDYLFSSISKFFSFICINEKKHNGNIVGLIRKIIHFPNEKNQELDYNRELKLPENFDIPNNHSIRFLSFIDEIEDEGMIMNHCVGMYISEALYGEFFFFHVNYNDFHATVALDKHGDIIEIQGPDNQYNEAVNYAELFFNNIMISNKPNIIFKYRTNSDFYKQKAAIKTVYQYPLHFY